MFVIIEGEYSDWKIKGYVTTEEDALSICAEHNSLEENSYDMWYYEKVGSFEEKTTSVEGFYEYHAVFKKDRTLSNCYMWSIFPDIYHKPEVIQDDEYCYVVRVFAKSEGKAAKIGKDFLMEFLAEREGIV